MGEPSLLLSFVGNRGLRVEHSEDFCPVLSLLQARPFDWVILFCTGADYLERSKMVEELCRGFGCAASFRQVSLELESPIDYAEILRKLGGLLQELRPELQGARLSVLQDPGTPQLQTAWLLCPGDPRGAAHLRAYHDREEIGPRMLARIRSIQDSAPKTFDLIAKLRH